VKTVKRQSVTAAQIEVIGRENDQNASYIFTKSAFDKMDQGTSMPAAIVAEMILAGEVENKGVLAPEQLDVKVVMQRLRKVGYLARDIGFNVNRLIDGEEASGPITDDELFSELW